MYPLNSEPWVHTQRKLLMNLLIQNFKKNRFSLQSKNTLPAVKMATLESGLSQLMGLPKCCWTLGRDLWSEGNWNLDRWVLRWVQGIAKLTWVEKGRNTVQSKEQNRFTNVCLCRIRPVMCFTTEASRLNLLIVARIQSIPTCFSRVQSEKTVMINVVSDTWLFCILIMREMK